MSPCASLTSWDSNRLDRRKQTIIIDDDDRNQIRYSGNWHISTGNVKDYLQTVHGTISTGSSAVVRFNGTGVRVLGSVPPTESTGQCLTQYTLDSGPVQQVLVPFHGGTEILFAQEYFNNQSLSESEEHTLTITYLSGTVFWLDFIEVTTESDTTRMPTIPSGTNRSTSSPSASGKTSGDTATHQSLSPGLIAGIVLGVLAFLALLSTLSIMQMRRRNKRMQLDPRHTVVDVFRSNTAVAPSSTGHKQPLTRGIPGRPMVAVAPHDDITDESPPEYQLRDGTR